MKNIIILGPGRTGSSILAGIISEKGFYINIESIYERKGYPQGDYENPGLINLNKEILHKAGYTYDFYQPNTTVDIKRIESIVKDKNTKQFELFIDKCNEKGPWLWKDPRLVFTMYMWKHFLDVDNINFIIVTRDPYQIFRSHSKNHIKFTKSEIYQRYYYQMDMVNKFIKENKIKYLHIDYDEFRDVDNVLNKLNIFLGIEITIDDYNGIYQRNIKRKESTIGFWYRYFLGWLIIKISRKNATHR